jgi:succinoglycan biosynthesis transport protein ExoP
MSGGELSKPRQPDSLAPTATREEQEGASSGPSLTALLKALRRRWLLASFLSLTLTGLTLAAVWKWLPPPKHMAQAVLYVAATKPSLIDAGGQFGGEFVIYQQSQKALLTSRQVLSAALSDPQVMELATVKEQGDPVDWLQKELKIDFKIGPEYMRATLSGDHPEELKVLLAAICEAYLLQIVNRERNKNLAHLEQLKEIQSKYEDLLRRRRESLLRLSQDDAKGPQGFEDKQRYARETLEEAEKELHKTTSDLRRLQLDLKAQAHKEKAVANVEVPEELVEREILKDSLLLQERARESQLQKRIDALRPHYRLGEDDPSLAPLVTERKAIRDGIEARRKELGPLITRQLRQQALQDAKLTTARLKERESFLKGLAEQLKTEIAALNRQKQMPNLGHHDLENIRQEIAQAEKISEQVTGKAEVLKIELQAPARVTLVEEAYVTQDDPMKRKVKVAALANVGVLFAVLGLVSWFEYRRRRIEGVREVQDEVGIGVLGTLPILPVLGRGPGGERDDAYRSWQGLLTECVDATRTRLIHAADGEGVRVVMVTSALPREGKTTLARHLAMSLARAGRRTLLVDGDLRLPTLHHSFGLAPQPGLAEVLRGEADAAEAMQPTRTEGLWVMPAGDADVRALQALAREPLRLLIPRLRQQYDCVVIDSGPILPVSDGLQIGQQVDGVILSVLRGVSQVPMVRAAHQRLTDLNVRVLGAVVSGADLKSVYGPWYSRGYAKIHELAPGADGSDGDDGTWYSRGYAKTHEQLPSAVDAELLESERWETGLRGDER